MSGLVDQLEIVITLLGCLRGADLLREIADEVFGDHVCLGTRLESLDREGCGAYMFLAIF
jgi:hypothetical protein